MQRKTSRPKTKFNWAELETGGLKQEKNAGFKRKKWL